MFSMNSPSYTPSRLVRLLVIHCAATPNDRDLFSGKPGTPGFRTPIMEIDDWHAARDFQRSSYWRGRQNSALRAVGYHYVIGRNGALFSGRHHDEIGAHAMGWNAESLGICLLGTDRYTAFQWEALAANVRALARHYEIPLAPPLLTRRGAKGVIERRGVCGHGTLPGHNKVCPGFSVADWLANGLQPLADHTDGPLVKVPS
jgi:hypothetical protein